MHTVATDKECEEIRDKAYSSEPDSISLYYYLGCLVERGKIREALIYGEEFLLKHTSIIASALADFLYSKNGAKPDEVLWEYYCRKAADSGNTVSAEEVANHYYHKEKYEDAITYYKLAAELNVAEATVAMGYLYENGIGVEQDLLEAARWYLKICDIPEEKMEGDSFDITFDEWPVDPEQGWIDLEKAQKFMEHMDTDQRHVFRELLSRTRK